MAEAGGTYLTKQLAIVAPDDDCLVNKAVLLVVVREKPMYSTSVEAMLAASGYPFVIVIGSPSIVSVVLAGSPCASQ